MTYRTTAIDKALDIHKRNVRLVDADKLVEPEIFISDQIGYLISQTITDLLDELEKEMGEESKEYAECEDCGRSIKRGTEVPLDGEGNCVAGGTHHHLECLPNTLHRKLTKKFNQIRE